MDAGRHPRTRHRVPAAGRADGRVAWSEGEDEHPRGDPDRPATEQRERLRLPDFGGGLGRFLFEPNTAATRRGLEDRIAKALARWEPRIAVESVDVDADPDDPQAAIATITTGSSRRRCGERVTVTVALAGMSACR